jgi:hypothetical protein
MKKNFEKEKVMRKFFYGSLKIHIIGCGGNGSHLTNFLATYMRAVRLNSVFFNFVDADIIESSNLARQPFNINDVGKAKARVVSERFCFVSGLPLPYVQFHTGFFGCEDSLKIIDWRDRNLFFLCVDNVSSRQAIWSAIKGTPETTIPQQKGTPWGIIDMGNDATSGWCCSTFWNSQVLRGTDPRVVYPNLAIPANDAPVQGGRCGQAVASVPQTLPANIFTANLALQSFLAIQQHDIVIPEQQWAAYSGENKITGLDMDQPISFGT